MKHLELFKEGFDSTIDEKIKPENWPYVGYDPIQDSVRYTEILKPMIGPADNEIWYTTVDESLAGVIPGFHSGYLIGNEYNNGIGKYTFSGNVTLWESLYFIETRPNTLVSVYLPKSVTSIPWAPFKDAYTDMTQTNLTDLYFNGTKEQWNQVDKCSDWAECTSISIVHCIDGDVIL